MTRRITYLMALFAALLALCSAQCADAAEMYSDVPRTHWAYSAIERLAARGVLTAEEGARFAGSSPASRYDFAVAIARLTESIDRRRASREDAELVARLVNEFSREMADLGGRAGAVGSRVDSFESGLGGWAISGQFRFDAKLGRGSGMYDDWASDTAMIGANDFDLSRYRIELRRRVGDGASFTARLGRGARYGDGRAAARFDQYYATASFFSIVSITAGVKDIDWEDDLGLRMGDGSYMGGGTFAQFHAKADVGFLGAHLVLGRLNDTTGTYVADDVRPEEMESFIAAGMLTVQPTERTRAGAMAYVLFSDEAEGTYASSGREIDRDLTTVGLYAAHKIAPSVELKAVGYYQRLSPYQSARADGSADAFFWRAMIDAGHDALGCTSLWLEYGEIDDNFTRLDAPSPYGGYGADIFSSIKFGPTTSRFWAARAEQRWGEKFRTFERFVALYPGAPDVRTADQLTLGAAYRLSPAAEIELGYEHISAQESDDVLRLRTFVSF